MIFRIPKTIAILGIVLLLSALVFFIVGLFLLFSPTPETEIAPTPSPTPYLIQQGANPSRIRPKQIYPPEKPNGDVSTSPSQRITYSFKEPVYPAGVHVTVSPPLPVTVKRGALATDLIVAPDPPDFWKPDVLYTVTVVDLEGRTIAIYHIKVPRLKVQEAD
jgi:hypothetical protein